MKEFSVKTWSWIVGVAAAIMIVALLLFGLSIAERFGQVNEKWRAYNEQATATNQALAELRGSVGYGGFIHNFKNYVLRHDDVYRNRVEKDITRIDTNLNRLRGLLSSAPKHRALLTIEGVLATYFEKFSLAQEMVAEGRSSIEIDAAVSVDDQAALQAFSVLVELTAEESRTMETQTDAELRSAIRFLYLGALLALVVLGVAVLLVLFVRRITRANSRLQDAHDRIDTLFDTAPDAMICVRPDGTIAKCNYRAESLFGYARSELLGMAVETLIPEAFRERHAELRDSFFTSESRRPAGAGLELVALTKDGREPPVEIGLSLSGTGGDSLATITLRDITARKNLEDRLASAQRLEAIGQLTGGIAHDFNNLLAIIIGNIDHLEASVSGDETAKQSIEAVTKAVERGSSLTNRLLAFSRQQILSPVAVNVADLVNGLVDMLRRTLGETISLNVNNAPDLWPVAVDPHQFENALLNLAINARHAMPDGGTLAIEVSNVTLADAISIQHEEVAAGDYLEVSVSDTGTGMTPEVLEKAFEPFFTTKDVGEGSGLGLSMVYGFAKQSKGYANIFSEVGKGSTVKLYLPRSKEAAVLKDPEEDRYEPELGSGRILVVEDDLEVRKVQIRILETQGYKVDEACNGAEAIDLLKRGDPFDLLFTDVVLPGGMSGVEIADEATRIQPGIKVLFTSGYAENIIRGKNRSLAEMTLVNKPFRRAELLEKVGAVLAGDAT